MLKHLKTVRGYHVEENSPGIYTVKGDIVPIQIIDSRQLSADENVWLKNLSNRLDAFSVIKINDELARLDKAASVKAYINVIVKTNYQAIEEAMEMREPAKSLEEVLERTGINARAEARGEARGREREAITIAQNMVNLGIPFETVVSATKLDPDKVKTMYEK